MFASVSQSQVTRDVIDCNYWSGLVFFIWLGGGGGGGRYVQD